MRPETFLTARGKKLFERLATHLKNRGLSDESYSLELSILCNEYDQYLDACKLGEKEGWVNYYESGPQANAYATMKQRAFDNIKNLSARFGFTPKDFKAIRDSQTKPKESATPLMELMSKKA